MKIDRFAAVAAVAAGVVLWKASQAAADADALADLESTGEIDTSIGVDMQDAVSAITAGAQGDVNIRAFLEMIATSEGTKGRGDDGYNVLVGGELFFGYDDHPRRAVWIQRLGVSSTAAGRYQMLSRTWDGVARRLGLVDFSPMSQDAACVELVRQRGALSAVRAGDFERAVYLCRKEWASLPGAGYGQSEQRIERLRAAFINAGGMLAA